VAQSQRLRGLPGGWSDRNALVVGRSCTPAGAAEWLPSLRGGSDEWSDLLDALGRLYVRGASVDWRAFHAPLRRRLISLPTYPFERSRHWVEVPETLTTVARSWVASAPAKVALDPARWVPRSRWEIPAGRCATTSLCDFSQVAASLDEEHHTARDDSGAKLEVPYPKSQNGEDHHAERDDNGERSAHGAADRFAAAHVQRAFRDLGFFPSPGETWTTATLGERLGIKPSFNRLLGRMLEMLAEDGWLFRDGDRWEAGPGAWDDVEPGGLLRGLLERQPDHEAELTLADGCGRRLAAVLRGEVDPLLILFPDGSPDLLARIYGDAPAARASNRLVAGTIAKGIESLPADRIVRIVEIGAGTGGTTAHVLSKLPRGRCEYLFTDVSSLFINHARERFREHRFVQYRPLDIERDPALSGFAPHQFDIVLAANVLHATADLKRSLAHARQLLAPGGWLILLEGTGRERILDLVFGLTAGWWKYADPDLRPDYPLISRESWLALLGSEGFTGAAAVAPTPDAQQVVFLGRAPSTVCVTRSQSGRATGAWLIRADEPGNAAGLAQRLEAEGACCSLASGTPPGPPLSRGGEGASSETGPTRVARHVQLCTAPGFLASSEITQSESPSWVVTRGLAGMEDQIPSTKRWVDLDPAVSLESSLDQLVRELLDPDDAPFVAFRDGQRYVAAREIAAMWNEPAAGDTESTQALRGVEPADRRQRIQDAVCSELARTLNLPGHAIEVDRPMVSFGLDSLMAIQLKNRVEARAGVSISVVKLLEGLTAAQLAAEIDETLSGDENRPESQNGFGQSGHHESALGCLGNGEHLELDTRPSHDSIDGIDDLSELELDVLIDDLLIGTDEHD